MKRVLAGWAAWAPLVAVVGLLSPPPVHSHAGATPVPLAESDPCAGGDVHLHGAHTHATPCPACAAGPGPTAAPPCSASQPRPSHHTLLPRVSPVSFSAAPVRHTRSRAPPADLL